MRMAGPDIVLFVVGAVLFGGATYAIVAMDGDVGSTSAIGVFNVDWAPETVEIGELDVANMRSASETFEVNQTRILGVVVTVGCNDPAGATPLTFSVQVTVEGPGGITGEGSGACGSDIVVEIPDLGELPEPTNVAGSTSGEARENLGEGDPSPAAGTWTVGVSGARQAGAPVGLPVGDPTGSITFAVEVAAPQFTPVQR